MVCYAHAHTLGSCHFSIRESWIGIEHPRAVSLSLARRHHEELFVSGAAAADGRTARRGEWERERHEGHKGRSENNTCALSGPPLFRPNRDGNANESRKPIRALGRESGGDGDIPSGERREGG